MTESTSSASASSAAAVTTGGVEITNPMCGLTTGMKKSASDEPPVIGAAISMSGNKTVSLSALSRTIGPPITTDAGLGRFCTSWMRTWIAGGTGSAPYRFWPAAKRKVVPDQVNCLSEVV